MAIEPYGRRIANNAAEAQREALRRTGQAFADRTELLYHRRARQISGTPTVTDSPLILASAQLPFGVAELVEWRWPSPMDVTVRSPVHMIELSLPPLSTDGTASFPDIAPDRSSIIGSLFLRPAGVAIRARSVGGHVRVVRLAAQPIRFAEVAGADIGWEEDVLRVALDLRADGPRRLLHRIREELTGPGFASAALVEAYATALMIETARALREGLVSRQERGRLAGWQYRRVCERIETPGAPPTMSELAMLCGLSIRHFLRLYRALTGETPAAHIARAQRARAIALVEDDALPLKQVAARLGFAHASSFSEAFRRETGISPSRYRQRNRRR